MSVKKKKADKLEGLRVKGEKEINNPEIEEKIYTSPIKIGDREFIIKPLSMLNIKGLNIERKKMKKDDDNANYDYTFFSLLTVIKKWNPEAKDMTVEELEELIDVDQFERVSNAIVQLAGLQKYFILGGSGK